MTHHLLVNPGTPQAWEIQLKSGQNRLGRGEQNDFQVNHPSVSGSHCEILVSSAGVLLKDLGSTNGTFVNRAPVHEALLHTGQHVHLGGVEMLFEATGPAAAPDPGTASVAAPPAARINVPRPAAGQFRVSQAPASEPAAAAVKSPPSAPPSPPMRVSDFLRSRTALESPPTAPPEAPPLAPPVAPPLPPPVSLPAAGPAFCKSHQKTPARFLCEPCQKYFCDLCVTTREVGGVTGKFCRACGAECVPVQVPVTRPAGPKGFFARLPGAFLYPFHGSGVLVLILGTLVLPAFQTASRFLALFYGAFGVGTFLALIVQALVAGYLFSYLQNVVHCTAAADEEMPPLPGLGNFWSDILVPALQLLGLILVCFGAAVALASIAQFYSVPAVLSAQSPPAFLDLLVIASRIAEILGAIYFPMAFLAVAMKDSVLAANPLVVVPAIIKVPLEYLAILVILGAVLAIRHYGDLALIALFPRSVTTHSMPKLLAMFGLRAFWSCVQLYLLTVNVRILALLYVTRKEKFGWFSR